MCTSKYEFMLYALNNLDIEYTDEDSYLFFDADTIYIKRPKKTWNQLSKILSKYDLVVNPYCWFKCPGYGEKMCQNYGEEDAHYAGYYEINENSVNICSNVLGGTIKGLKMVKEDLYNMLDKDININLKKRHFPCVNEETYINKIVNDFISKKSDKYNIYIDMFHYTPFPEDHNLYQYLGSYKEQIKNNPLIICNSKYNNSYKIKTMPPFLSFNYDKEFDKVYVIDTNNTSYDKIKGYFERFNITNFEYVHSISDKFMLYSSNIPDVNEMKLTHTHYMIIKSAYEQGFNKILVFEDNIRFKTKRGLVDAYMMNISKYAGDVILLDYLGIDSKYYPISSSAYILNRTGMKFVLDQYENENIYNIKYILGLLIILNLSAEDKSIMTMYFQNLGNMPYINKCIDNVLLYVHNERFCLNSLLLYNPVYIKSIENLTEYTSK